MEKGRSKRVAHHFPRGQDCDRSLALSAVRQPQTRQRLPVQWSQLLQMASRRSTSSPGTGSTFLVTARASSTRARPALRTCLRTGGALLGTLRLRDDTEVVSLVDWMPLR